MFFYVEKHQFDGIGIERGYASQEFEQHNTHTPPINDRILQTLAIQNLWSYIIWSTYDVNFSVASASGFLSTPTVAIRDPRIVLLNGLFSKWGTPMHRRHLLYVLSSVIGHVVASVAFF